MRRKQERESEREKDLVSRGEGKKEKKKRRETFTCRSQHGRNFRMKYEPWYFTRRDASPAGHFAFDVRAYLDYFVSMLLDFLSKLASYFR